MKKTNIVLDIGIPLLGCLACGMMISMLWQMRSANQIAQLAEQNGPIKVKFEELLTRDDLAQQHVEISEAHVAPKYSLSKQDHGMSGCFLLFPEQRFEIDPNHLPIIIQVSTIENQEDAAQFSKRETFTGTVSTYGFLNFDHQRTLKLCYPQLELDRCVVISSPGRCYSEDANFVAISGMIFFGVLLLATFAWLCKSVINAFKQGFTFSPSSEVPPAPTKPSFFHDTNWHAKLGEVASDSKVEKDASYVPRMYSLSYIAKVLGVAAFTPTLMMAFAGKVNLLPANLFPIFYKLLAVSAGFLIIYLIAIFYRLKTGGKNVRWTIPKQVPLPRRFQRAFDRCDRIVEPLGFQPQGNFQMKEKARQVARFFLSDDRKIVVRYVVTDETKILIVYSLLSNGQLLLTTDTPLGDLNDYRVNLLEAVKGDFEKSLSLHRQVVGGFDEFVVRIEPNEAHAFWEYTEAIEEQMTGDRPYGDQPLPVFRNSAITQNANQTELVEVG